MTMPGNDRIQLAHGGGGRLSRELIANEIVPRFGNGSPADLPDAAALELDGGRLVFTTDSFVVQPLFFPGGNIGDLAVHGTINDLAVSGAAPMWLSLGLIIEEGMEIKTLGAILDSLRSAAAACGVSVVTGDTKVVSRGQCDGLYINTAGIGKPMPGFELDLGRIRAGDHVLVSGDIAEHGLAVMAAREGLGIDHGPRSDTGPVHRLVDACSGVAAGIRFMRDPTRGGLAAVLNEIVEGRDFGIELEQTGIPLSGAAKAVVELLGLDPLQVACEGRVVMVCDPGVSGAVLAAWQGLAEGRNACKIGTVTDESCRVTMRTLTGGRRLVDVPRGELLPRIC